MLSIFLPIMKLPSVVTRYFTCCMEPVMIRQGGYNSVKFLLLQMQQ